MKTLKHFLSCVILSGMIPGNLLSQEPAVIKIDFDRKIGAIDPNIYSGFVEPIRTTVYGNIYDPSSPLADENGFRKDLIQLLTQLKIRSLRWPGGNYVSGYNWEDGIGPKNQRPARMDLAWHQIETNQMGTDEYAKFTSLIGAQNFVCMEVQKKKIHLYLKLNPKNIATRFTSYNGIRDVSKIGHYGTGDLEVPIVNEAELEFVKPMIKAAYEEIGG